jgi:endoglucanase
MKCLLPFPSALAAALAPLLVLSVLFNMSLPLAHCEQLAPLRLRPVTPGRALAGINLSGAEFGGKLPGVVGKEYTYPTPGELDYFHARGRTLIRLPFRWERMQRSLNAPLDLHELILLRGVLRAAGQRRMRVILDLHSYGRYQVPSEEGQIIGTERVPVAAFADFWSKLAQAVKNEPGLYAYGLMNEPHDMGDVERWPRAAQAAVESIRRVDMRTPIIVPGDDWSSARRWRESTNKELHLKVRDPRNNLIFEAHCYFDKDGSGTYKGTYEAESASPNAGVEYARPFVEWCRENRVRGFIGEYGVPNTDTRWLITMDRFLAYLDANNISSAYWSAGPWWGGYALSIEPEDLDDKAPQTAIDRPQMIVLRQYRG